MGDVGWECDKPKAGMYLWLPLPAGVESGPFARDVLEREGLAVMAGSAFGAAGEGFVRLSFIVGPDRLREAATRLGRAFINSARGGVTLRVIPPRPEPVGVGWYVLSAGAQRPGAGGFSVAGRSDVGYAPPFMVRDTDPCGAY